MNRPPAGWQRCSRMRMGIQAAETPWAHGGSNVGLNVHGGFSACMQSNPRELEHKIIVWVPQGRENQEMRLTMWCQDVKDLVLLHICQPFAITQLLKGKLWVTSNLSVSVCSSHFRRSSSRLKAHSLLPPEQWTVSRPQLHLGPGSLCHAAPAKERVRPRCIWGCQKFAEWRRRRVKK